MSEAKVKLQLFSQQEKDFSTPKAARAAGFVPGVLYARGKETRSFYVNDGDLGKLLKRYGASRQVTLEFNGKTSAIFKEVQKEAIKGTYLHIDMQELDENEPIRVTVHISVINREAVEKDGKILQVQMNDIELQMLPRYIPDSIEVDAAILTKQEAITLADLDVAKDEHITILSELESVIATLVYVQEESTEDASSDETAEPELIGENKE